MVDGKKLNRQQYRDNPGEISRYLNDALAKEDLAALLLSIGDVLRAQNVLAISEETGLRRENLYRMFDGHRDPTLGNTLKILASFGVQLVIQPRASGRAKPPRPKLGRPSKRRPTA
jgi:probable addiction module antidote protein